MSEKLPADSTSDQQETAHVLFERQDAAEPVEAELTPEQIDAVAAEVNKGASY